MNSPIDFSALRSLVLFEAGDSRGYRDPAFISRTAWGPAVKGSSAPEGRLPAGFVLDLRRDPRGGWATLVSIGIA